MTSCRLCHRIARCQLDRIKMRKRFDYSAHSNSVIWPLLGRVALVAQRPIVVKLSRGRSVGPYVRTSVGRSVQCIVENGRSDPDAVWYHRSDGSR